MIICHGARLNMILPVTLKFLQPTSLSVPTSQASNPWTCCVGSRKWVLNQKYGFLLPKSSISIGFSMKWIIHFGCIYTPNFLVQHPNIAIKPSGPPRPPYQFLQAAPVSEFRQPGDSQTANRWRWMSGFEKPFSFSKQIELPVEEMWRIPKMWQSDCKSVQTSNYRILNEILLWSVILLWYHVDTIMVALWLATPSNKPMYRCSAVYDLQIIIHLR